MVDVLQVGHSGSRPASETTPTDSSMIGQSLQSQEISAQRGQHKGFRDPNGVPILNDDCATKDFDNLDIFGLQRHLETQSQPETTACSNVVPA